MKVSNLLENEHFTLINTSANTTQTVSGIFSCDLLSHVMANAEEDNVLITILNNINVLGVASLLELSCVIFTHNTKVREDVINKANDLGIPLIKTSLTTSQTTILLHNLGVDN